MHVEQTHQLQGDLLSSPSPDRRLWSSEVQALDFLLQTAQVPQHQYDIVRGIIRDHMEIVERELASASPLLDELIRDRVHHQLRSRPSFEQGDIVVEQWVPALRCWLISGRWPSNTPAQQIVNDLLAGDPRRQSAEEANRGKRDLAATKRAENDAAAGSRIEAALDSLSSRALDQFIEVERALHTGETIRAHGDDANFIERNLESTKKAAASGDKTAQHILTHGRGDNQMCVNPGDNPLKR